MRKRCKKNKAEEVGSSFGLETADDNPRFIFVSLIYRFLGLDSTPKWNRQPNNKWERELGEQFNITGQHGAS